MGAGCSAANDQDALGGPRATSFVPTSQFGAGNGTGSMPGDASWSPVAESTERYVTFGLSKSPKLRVCDGPADGNPGQVAKEDIHSDAFLACNLFDDDVMQRMISAATFRNFVKSRDNGTKLTEADGDEIAVAMMKFAMDRGALNYAHWFSPVRGEPIRAINGMKYDGFLDLDFESSNPYKPIKPAVFTGERLFYNETDGSSFPNGGTRVTHSAAAFNQWDKSSPPFVWKDTLYLPSAFVGWNGFALDHKTPLLRSHDAIQKQGIRLLRHLGDRESKRFTSYLGWEQEFFVVTTEMYLARPDLRNCGRTLIGALPPRHQQSDMNYFAAMPDRVKGCLEEVQAECLRLGISFTCYHNEVAPAQHEFSPIFSASQIAVDQNQIVFEMCEQIGTKHGLVFLWHEKPFAGINGSGKHNNWSLQTDTGKNVFKAGDDPKTQREFMTFISCLAAAVNKHGDTIRCSISGAGNDHRLGAQEAPPAIMTLYTGKGVQQKMKEIINGGPLEGYSGASLDLDPGGSSLQQTDKPAEDRNRTAPIPFSGGNRFEIRAVGSSQNCAFPIMVFNTIMADTMCELSDRLDGGATLRDAVAGMLKENFRAVFCGNGYSKEWPIEAARRGLPNLRTTPDALMTFNSPKNVQLFKKHKIFRPEETHGRAETMYEAYINQVSTEAETMMEMMDTGIVPALVKDLKNFQNQGREAAGRRPDLYNSIFEELEVLRRMIKADPSEAANEVDALLGDLVLDDSEVSESLKELRMEARHLCDVVLPQMKKVRDKVDTAEKLCQKEHWPFPTYVDVIFGHHTDTRLGAPSYPK